MKTLKKVLVITGNILLLLLLGANFYRLYQIYLNAQTSLNGDILAGNPDQLIANINAATPLWLWIVSGASVLISLFVVVGWLIPKLRRQMWFWRLNFIWLWLWIVYLVLGAIALVLLFNSLA